MRYHLKLEGAAFACPTEVKYLGFLREVLGNAIQASMMPQRWPAFITNSTSSAVPGFEDANTSLLARFAK
jgi:hypothetical protein